MKKKRPGFILTFTFLLLALAGWKRVAFGAGEIDTGKLCTVTFRIEEEYTELKGQEIPVALYKVAEVDPYGRYTPAAGYESLKAPLQNVSSATTADDWKTMAEQAASLQETGSLEAARTVNLGETAEELQTGLYLVRVEPVESETCIYQFTPYLIALPDNERGRDEEAEDAWIYEVSVKPELTDRYGSLEVQKTLVRYNQTLGPVTCIFQIEGEKDGRLVYSDVVSVTFDSPGTRSIRIPRIAAGARVTVTEVYSGAGYAAQGASSQSAAVVADSTLSLFFSNDYAGGTGGGTSVVNHFYYENDQWNYVPETDSTGEQEGRP